jgi:hypothetical protein
MEAVEELDAWKRELVQLHLFKTRVQEEQAELADGMEKYERRRQVGKPEYHIRTIRFRLDPVLDPDPISVLFGGSRSALGMYAGFRRPELNRKMFAFLYRVLLVKVFLKP